MDIFPVIEHEPALLEGLQGLLTIGFPYSIVSYITAFIKPLLLQGGMALRGSP